MYDRIFTMDYREIVSTFGRCVRSKEEMHSSMAIGEKFESGFHSKPIIIIQSFSS